MKNNMKKVLSLLLAVLMMASLSVTAFAATGDFTGDTLEKNDIKAYYKVVHESDYTDTSGVKLTWSVPVVKYTKTDTKTWDTSTLKWVQSDSEDTTGTDVTFTLANYGSYAVKANVSFTPTVTDSASVSFVKNEVDTNNPTLATVVKDDHSLKVAQGTMDDTAYATAKTKYITDNCSATISGTVSLVASKLDATSGKLGTYTVKISDAAAAKLLTITQTTTSKNQFEFPITKNELILSGTTWDEVIEANKDNRITFTVDEDDYVMHLGYYEDTNTHVNYVFVLTDANDPAVALVKTDTTKIDYDEAKSSGQLIASTDAIPENIYFFVTG